MLKLIIPSEKYIAEYLDYCRISYDTNSRISTYDPKNFYAWKDHIISKYHLESINSKVIHYWAIDDNKFIGEVVIRLNLNEMTIKNGGNIEFKISKNLYNQGYGSLVLAEALKKAKHHGIIKALLTCNDNDIASIKIIEKNGGKLDTKIINTDLNDQMLTRKYWISL